MQEDIDEFRRKAPVAYDFILGLYRDDRVSTRDSQ